uniref:Gypsy retrotransposon integrase-like protein 1 n=2 Tax=Cyprinus carpio TaxID=7962 RepID=A0A8C2FFT4_CYPCA
MAMFGTVGEFVEDSGDWLEYTERLEHFFAANEITDEDKKRSILLSVCGAKTYKLMRNLATPRKPGDLPYKDLIDLIQNHHSPKPSVIVQRFKFHSHFRKSGDSIAKFVAELRQLSEHCEFGAVLEDMLRDRLVCGINDDVIQRRLLGEATLSFTKAMEIAQGMESAALHAKDIQKANSSAQSDVFQVTKAAKGKAVECYRCGGAHFATSCKFKEAVCHNCGKKGHLAKKCRSNKWKVKNSKDGGKPHSKTHHIGEAEQEETCSYSMFNLSESRSDPLYATIQVNGASLKMEIDTGASASIISEETYGKLWINDQTPALCESSIKLRTYTGEIIPVMGAVKVNIAYGSQTAEARLLVVKGTGPSLLGRDWLSKIQLNWGDIRLIKGLGAKDVIARYQDVFKDELGTLRGTTVKLCVEPNAVPRFCKPRSVPYAMKHKVEQELERLQQLGIIEPIQFSNWAAPIVPVLKEDGTVRICGDYKLTINQAAKLETYPIPRVEDLFSRLVGGKTFTKLDMSHAYQQLLLDEESKKYVTVNTHKGLFKYNRLVFGVASSPAIFQRTMESLLQGIPQVAVYLDDILVTGKTEEEHLSNLDQVLQRMSEAGLRLKQAKCTFQAESVTYLGHQISAQGLLPVPEKVRAIKEAPKPGSVSELKSFLGMVTYYGKFLPDLSTVLAPLYQLLHHGCQWKWGAAQAGAFTKVKNLLQSASVLVHFDPEKELTVSCDASPYGIGAVLSHRMGDGSEKPIAFASRTLTKAERGYAQLDKEGLAIVFAVKRFHQYLYGRPFTVFTDHKPLMSLFSEHKGIPSMASARIQRWALTLSAYQYRIVYRAGKENANADALSRLPLPDIPASTPLPPETVFLLEKLSDSPVSAKQIKTWTERDKVLSKVKRFILQGWPGRLVDIEMKPFEKRKNELSVQDGCILWGSRVVVPPPGRARVLQEVHIAHPGVSRMKSLARAYVWWPNMDRDIEDKVQHCKECQENQKMPPPVPLQPWEWPSRPWSRLHVDFAGPFMGRMFLVMVDACTKWLEAHILKNITAPVTIDTLRQVFSIHGLPDVVVSDNGPTFTGEFFQEFLKKNGIRHIRTAPFHPASNGLAERAVQTLKEGLKKMSGANIETNLSRFLFQYRITPQTTTGLAPAEMLLGRKPKSHLDLLHPDVGEKVRVQQEKQKAWHDRHARERSFREGEAVFVRNFARGQRWLPGSIVKESGPRSCVVRLSDGREVRRH